MSNKKKSDIAFFNGRNITRNNRLSLNEIYPEIDKNNIDDFTFNSID